MNRLAWIPEVFPPSGGLAAKGFYKLLGRPRLDPLTVLVRETAQNSWDARQSDELAVGFGLVGRTMSSDQRQALHERVFTDCGRAPGTLVARKLGDADLVGLHIFDRGTKGLGGPTQADTADPDDVYDWVDFVLNVGKENTAGHTGGTYGFGKTISYIVSGANAIVIHSRTMQHGRPESRLIACAIGEGFEMAGRLHTGRHWWGAHAGTVPEPVLDDAADEIAAALGMPPFGLEDLGTNILVVAPDFAGRTGEQAMRFIAESVIWNLWPKVIARSGRPGMSITVAWEDAVIPVPSPEERPPLHGFARALRALDDDDVLDADPGAERSVIRCHNPKTDVGDLVTVAFARRPRAEVDDGHDPTAADSPSAAAAIVGAAHHVALIRSPELVVEYQAGPPPADDGIEWAGVFRCRFEHDEKFAQAEPPTHDSWRPELLPKGRNRTIVNVGLRRIAEAVESRWASPTADSAPTPSSTARIAELLSPLVGATTGLGAGKPDDSHPRRPRRPRPRARRSASVEIVSSRPEIVGTEVVTRVVLDLHPERGSAGTILTLRAGVATEWAGAAGRDIDPNLGLAAVDDGSGMRAIEGLVGHVKIGGDSQRRVAVLVSRGPNTSVLLDASAEAIVSEVDS